MGFENLLSNGIAALALIVSFLAYLSSKAANRQAEVNNEATLKLSRQESNARVRAKMEELGFWLTRSRLQGLEDQQLAADSKALLDRLPPQLSQRPEVDSLRNAISEGSSAMSEHLEVTDEAEDVLKGLWKSEEFNGKIEAILQEYCSLLRSGVEERSRWSRVLGGHLEKMEKYAEEARS